MRAKSQKTLLGELHQRFPFIGDPKNGQDVSALEGKTIEKVICAHPYSGEWAMTFNDNTYTIIHCCPPTCEDESEMWLEPADSFLEFARMGFINQEEAESLHKEAARNAEIASKQRQSQLKRNAHKEALKNVEERRALYEQLKTEFGADKPDLPEDT